MALIGNYTVLNKNPGRFLGGVGSSESRSNFNDAGSTRNLWVGGIDIRASIPDGYRGSSALNMAVKSGGMSSHTELIEGLGDITSGNLAGGLNAEADLSGSGTISNAALSLIVQAVAALTGSATLTADISARVLAAASLTGSGTINSALLQALGFLVANVTGQGTFTGVQYATGELSADIRVTGDVLNTANVGTAVWGAVAALNNEPGSMGELENDITTILSRLPAALVSGKMDSALSSSERDAVATALLDLVNTIETGITVREAFKLVAAGFGGKTSGFATLTPKFRDINDTKDVIDATITTDGDRTSVTLDLS